MRYIGKLENGKVSCLFLILEMVYHADLVMRSDRRSLTRTPRARP
jgi:hypothetical protein